MEKLNGCIFLRKMANYEENITVFGIKSVIALRQNFILTNLQLKIFENQNKVLDYRL